jgi:hypothetical protein
MKTSYLGPGLIPFSIDQNKVLEDVTWVGDKKEKGEFLGLGGGKGPCPRLRPKPGCARSSLGVHS